MNRPASLIATLLLGMTFIVGGLTGMALEEALGIDWFEFLDEDSEPGEAFLADLRLTKSQREAVEEIFEQQEDKLEEYWEGRLPEIRTIVEQTDNQIRAVLNPDQRSVFDQRVRTRGAVARPPPPD